MPSFGTGPGPRDRADQRFVRVAVQDEVDAAPAQHRAQGFLVVQRLAPRNGASGRRMVQDDDPEPVGVGRIRQGRVEARELILAQAARGQVRRGRPGRTQVEERDRPPYPNLWEGGFARIA